jgi:endo-1,4-beta-xylanase
MLTPKTLNVEGALAAVVCDVIVMASGVYWGSLESVEGKLDFTRADRVHSFARNHGKVVRGHPLVFHHVLPDWLVAALNRPNPGQLLEAHVANVVKHFTGTVKYWDVLNEIVAPQHHQPSGLRDTIFLQRIGASYIDRALWAARVADPGALLGYNEFGLEDDGALADAKRAAVLALLTKLRVAGTPIDYLGLQAHLGARESYSFEKLGSFLRAVRSLDLQVLITELDVDDEDLSADIAQRDVQVADTYGRFLDVVMASVEPSMVTTWGLSDALSWQQTQHPRRDGLPQRPLPFDENLDPKGSWDELVRRGIATSAPVPSLQRRVSLH